MTATGRTRSAVRAVGIRSLASLRSGPPSTRTTEQLQAQEAAGQKNVQANQQKVDELEAKLKDADNQLFRATTDFQTMKATYDQDRYDFEASRANGSSSSAKKEQIQKDEERRLDELNLAREKAEADKAAIQAQLGQYTGQIATVGKQIEEINAEQTRLRKRLDVIAPSAVKDYFRNAPLLDFLAPTLKVQQIILPNVVDDVNFIRVPKMDRARRHLAIDKKGYEVSAAVHHAPRSRRIPAAARSIPSADRVHRRHEGMGQSVNFRDAAHMPATRSRKRSGRRSTTGRSRICGITRCCR